MPRRDWDGKRDNCRQGTSSGRGFERGRGTSSAGAGGEGSGTGSQALARAGGGGKLVAGSDTRSTTNGGGRGAAVLADGEGNGGCRGTAVLVDGDGRGGATGGVRGAGTPEWTEESNRSTRESWATEKIEKTSGK